MHMGSNHGITNTLFWYPSDNLVKTYFQQLLFSIFWDFPTQRKNFILVQKITLLQRGNPRWPLIAKMFLGNKLYQRLLDAFSACHPLDSQVGIQLLSGSHLVTNIIKVGSVVTFILIRRRTKRMPMSCGWPSKPGREMEVKTISFLLFLDW